MTRSECVCVLAKELVESVIVFEEEVGGRGMESFGRLLIRRVESGNREFVTWGPSCCETLSVLVEREL
jgi:hypothetical protein